MGSIPMWFLWRFVIDSSSLSIHCIIFKQTTICVYRSRKCDKVAIEFVRIPIQFRLHKRTNSDSEFDSVHVQCERNESIWMAASRTEFTIAVSRTCWLHRFRNFLVYSVDCGSTMRDSRTRAHFLHRNHSRKNTLGDPTTSQQWGGSVSLA